MVSMLVKLKIENLGIVENQGFHLDKGLHIISGETGSGKSLLMNALDLALGARATSGLVRNGAHRAVIEALFDLSDFSGKEDIYKSICKQESRSQYLELRREITLEGRSKIFCNGEVTTLSQVRSLVGQLIEMHGQHEHQYILDTDTHLEFLDIFAETQELCQQVTEIYQRYSSICRQLHNVNLEAEQRENRSDFLHFALGEIEACAPQEGEFEKLNHEKALIQNSGQLFQDLYTAYNAIREDEASILSRLELAIQLMQGPHCKLIPQVQEHLEQMQEANYLLEAAADFLREQKECLQFSPERLEDINERLASYQGLYKKYGANTTAVLNTQRKYLEELGSIEMNAEQMEELKQEASRLYSILLEQSEKLSRLRRAAVPKLEQKLAQELAQLGMPGARLQVRIQREVKPDEADQNSKTITKEILVYASHSSSQSPYLLHEKGIDRVEFLLSSNLGEAFRPLTRIASGGELSRISLAFKSIFFDEKAMPTMIFDEIDAGVGGEVAHTIGKKLEKLAEKGQVLVVTHLPQIARLAHHHFCVSKEYSGGRVVSQLKYLQKEERLHEIARMLGGEVAGPVVLEHARELLEPTVKPAICSMRGHPKPGSI